jgi:hypothetical protein
MYTKHFTSTSRTCSPPRRSPRRTGTLRSPPTVLHMGIRDGDVTVGPMCSCDAPACPPPSFAFIHARFRLPPRGRVLLAINALLRAKHVAQRLAPHLLVQHAPPSLAPLPMTTMRWSWHSFVTTFLWFTPLTLLCTTCYHLPLMIVLMHPTSPAQFIMFFPTLILTARASDAASMPTVSGV